MRIRIVLAGLAVGAVAAAGITLAAPAAEAATNRPALVAAECRIFDGPTTFYACVPSFSPNGARWTRVWDDGSAEYPDGWVFEGDTGTFERA